MRSLIRPALFMVARIGLVLSVVGWVAEQRDDQWLVWILEHNTTAFSGSITVASAGYEIFAVATYQFPNVPIIDMSIYDGQRLWNGGGLFIERFGPVMVITIRHWLIVTFFALFYGVLKWVYRKRGKALADE